MIEIKKENSKKVSWSNLLKSNTLVGNKVSELDKVNSKLTTQIAPMTQSPRPTPHTPGTLSSTNNVSDTGNVTNIIVTALDGAPANLQSKRVSGNNNLVNRIMKSNEI